MSGSLHRILYVGTANEGSTSLHRANALRRLGHEVVHVDPYTSLGRWNRPYVRSLNYRSGYLLSSYVTRSWLRSRLLELNTSFDIAWIDGGELLSRTALTLIREHAEKLVLFNHDDPSGSRDLAKFRTLRRSIPAYDLCAVVRPFNLPEFFRLGAKDVVQVWRGYDEVAHLPDDTGKVPDRFKSDIAFIGLRQPSEDRDHVLLALIEAGLTPAIWGDNWQRSPLWPRLKSYWRGSYLSGKDYVHAIQGAKMCLGLLAKANRDEHTTRSMEIPYAGGLLCAERTAEHQLLYKEDEEAVFWSTSQECVSQCKRLLADDELRRRIREAGRKRVVANRVGNEDLCSHIIAHLSAGPRGFLVKKPGLAVPPPKRKVFFFDSHPVQYKAPVYQALQTILPDTFEVIYATDASVRPGAVDAGFGVNVVWDTPLLEGYRFRVLGNVRGTPFTGVRSLSGKGVFPLIRNESPRASVLVQSNYLFDLAAFISSLLCCVPMILRQETQDEMFRQHRGRLKSIARLIMYRLYYAPIVHALAFGELNREHLIRHGFRPEQISMAHFSVPNPLGALSVDARLAIRNNVRIRLNIPSHHVVLSFFGKFIPKKNPELLFHSLAHLSQKTVGQLTLLFVGAGELKPELDRLASEAKQKFGVSTIFTGFINQRKLPEYYLASDIVALPSRPMGEAWGLVINEALFAGCSVIMSSAVGCAPEFSSLERARVIDVEDELGLSKAIEQLVHFPRDLEWALDFMREYSTEAAAINIAAVLRKL